MYTQPSTDHRRSLPVDSKPIVVPQKLEIARKPKDANGTAETNGVTKPSNGILSKRKRSIGEVDIDTVESVKRSKVHAPCNAHDEVILVDDRRDGAIVIDDD